MHLERIKLSINTNLQTRVISRNQDDDEMKRHNLAQENHHKSLYFCISLNFQETFS